MALDAGDSDRGFIVYNVRSARQTGPYKRFLTPASSFLRKNLRDFERKLLCSLVRSRKVVEKAFRVKTRTEPKVKKIPTTPCRGEPRANTRIQFCSTLNYNIVMVFFSREVNVLLWF